MTVLDQLEAGCISRSAEETRCFAEALASLLPPECTLALYGDLGAGKTTFVQGLAWAWGIEETVTSPTFNLYTIYEGERRLVHFDAYRLNASEEAEELLIDDFLTPPYCLAVEWPEKAEAWLPPPVWRISLSIAGPGEHFIRFVRQPEGGG